MIRVLKPISLFIVYKLNTYRGLSTNIQETILLHAISALQKLRETEREGEMAKSKDDIKYGTAQARLSEDEAVRVSYKHGTPLEGGKIADSEPVDLFSSAHNLSSETPKNHQPPSDDGSTHQAAGAGHQSQLRRDPDAAAGGNATTDSK